MPPRQGTGHINWDQFVNANRSSATALANSLQSPIAQQGAEGQRLLDRGQGDFAWGVGDAEGRATLGRTDYAGPRSLADIPDYATGLEAAEKAQKGSKQLADIYGRAGLLGERFGATPGYGAGARTFDSALLGSVGQSGFEALRGQYGKSADAYRSAMDASRPLATAAEGRVKGSNTAWKQWDDVMAGADSAWGNPPAPASPTPVAPVHPLVDNAQRLKDENERLIRLRGGRG